METIREELNEIFFDDTQILQEMKLVNKHIINKINDKLVTTIKSRNVKTLDRLLKLVPRKSFDDIKMVLKKRAIKNKQELDRNYKVAHKRITKIKNKDAKDGLALVTATVATVTDKSVEQIIDENRKIFDPKNLIMLLLGMFFLGKYIIDFGGDVPLLINVAAAQQPILLLFFALALFMIIKSTYNLVAGKEAKSLFILI